MKKEVVVALVGSGYGGYLHATGYQRVSGINVRLKYVVDKFDIEKAKVFAKTYGIENAIKDIDIVLNDPEVDVVDIVTPPSSHANLVMQIAKAGKNIICEKPLNGYFGEIGDTKPIGFVSKRKMYSAVLENLEEIEQVIKESGVKFMYAENYVYSPNVLKSAEIIRRKKSKILYMKGEESLKGSSSPVAGSWEQTGGGSLIRVGTHPLAGLLWLKQVEAKARGEKIEVESVTANVGTVIPTLTDYERRHISASPIDVDDFANVTITFTDKTKAVVLASDTVLGGTKNYVEIYANDTTLMCNITPNDTMQSYLLDEDGIEDLQISEMLPSKLGWQKPFIVPEIIRGYTGELQDFAECIAYNREPLSNFKLAYDTMKVAYAAYLSSEEGVRIDF